MQMRAKVITTVAAGLLAGAGMFAPSASAAPADQGSRTAAADQTQAIQNTWVTTWTSANVRSCPSTACSINYSVGANYTFSAICYDEGETVSQHGYTHNKWVLLGSGQSWVWGGLLKGSQTGNVPNHC